MDRLWLFRGCRIVKAKEVRTFTTYQPNSIEIGTMDDFNSLSFNSISELVNDLRTLGAPTYVVQKLLAKGHLILSQSDVSLLDLFDRQVKVVSMSARESQGALAVAFSKLCRYTLSIEEFGTLVSKLNVLTSSAC